MIADSHCDIRMGDFILIFRALRVSGLGDGDAPGSSDGGSGDGLAVRAE